MVDNSKILDAIKEYAECTLDAELADLLGVSKAVISNWRNGKNKISVKKVLDKLPQIRENFILTGEGNVSHTLFDQSKNADNIAGRDVNISGDTGKFIEVILEQSRQLTKSQEQIDRLLTILEKKK